MSHLMTARANCRGEVQSGSADRAPPAKELAVAVVGRQRMIGNVPVVTSNEGFRPFWPSSRNGET